MRCVDWPTSEHGRAGSVIALGETMQIGPHRQVQTAQITVEHTNNNSNRNINTNNNNNNYNNNNNSDSINDSVTICFNWPSFSKHKNTSVW